MLWGSQRCPTPNVHSKRALGKLDPRRFKIMMDDMKTDALRRKPDAFPSIPRIQLALAFHVFN